MARFVAIAIILAIGAGLYAFMQTSSLTATRLDLANKERELADLKKRMGQNTTEARNATTALAVCKDQVTELQTALDTAKKPAGKR